MRTVSVGWCLLAGGGLWAQQFAISTYAGGAPILPVPATAVSAAIGSSQGIASDAAGNVYFTGLNCIFKMDQTGILTRIAGTGSAGYSGDGGPAASALLNNPTALAVDGVGNLFIADSGNGRVRKVSPSGVIATVAGNSAGSFNNGVGDGGPATSAPLFYPWQLAADPAGNVYIGEWNTPRVRKVSPDGIITTVAGNGTSGYSGDGGPATSAAMGSAWGLAFDSAGNLYISDDIPGDDYAPDSVRIRRVSADGIITTVAGTGDPGDTPDSGDGGPATKAQFAVSASLAVDGAGNLYISDYRRIRKVSTDGNITTVAGNGQSGYAGDGGPATSAEVAGTFYGPGLAADRAGNLYLADGLNNRVRKVSPGGIITTVAGNGNSACCYSGDGTPATSAQLNAPVGVAMDSAGNLFIADTFNNRLRKVSPAGIISTVAGNGTQTDPGDGGPANVARLDWPAGMALDSGGNLYIADSGNFRVRKISPDGLISTVAGRGDGGYSGDGGPATAAQLSWPKDVALDGSGNLYIADTVNNRVRMVSPAGIITTVAGNGDFGYSGDGGPAIGAALNQPSGLALDAAGNLYVADTNNIRVRKVSPGGIISTVAGTGVRGFSGDGGSATSARLVSPLGLKVDSAGNLYIADGASVRMVSPAGIITTVAGNGTVAGYSGDGGPANQALTGAWGLTFNSVGSLYFADPWNNVVRLLKPGVPK